MAPSRGLNFLSRSRSTFRLPSIRRYSDFVRAVTDSGNKTQVYVSRSLDPYLNLSIEHYLLQNTPEDSKVLFLYTNQRSVIIGRNQNPWTEVNLGLLRAPGSDDSHLLVRRRSGGGTVFHDEGNVNYCVICPTANFDRDKHAEMVVRALRGLGSKSAKVNCRHDIVVEETAPSTNDRKTFKVSGSAYKLTRKRSLHHGTCLLNTENLGLISRILRSPAKPFITARGVESVSSPVTNLGIPTPSFEKAVIFEFSALYDGAEPIFLGDAEARVPEIAKGVEELKSEEWIYGQTPQFTFSSKLPSGSEHSSGDISQKLLAFPENFDFNFIARYGRITEISMQDGDNTTHDSSSGPVSDAHSHLINRALYSITNWEDELFPKPPRLSNLKVNPAPGIGLNYLFGLTSSPATTSRSEE